MTYIICIFNINLHAGGFKIKVEIEGKQYDSLYIKAYQPDNQWQTCQAFPYKATTMMQGKKELSPGHYMLYADQLPLTLFFISDSKSQHFSIKIKEDKVTFAKSPENSANQAYIQTMTQMDDEIKQLNLKIRHLMNTAKPKEENRKEAEAVALQVEEINKKKRAIQNQVIADNLGTLLASLVRISTSMPTPSEEHYVTKEKYERYYAEHFFDNFPWNDSRILTSPVFHNKLIQFILSTAQMSKEAGTQLLQTALSKSRNNYTNHFFIIDFIEKHIGNQSSPQWNEGLYIAMMKEVLQNSKIDDSRTIRYNKELKRLDINHPGMTLPDFKIVLSTGDTTNLHSIEAAYLLLYLQNPDCPTCVETRGHLAKLNELNKAIESGKVKILTLYFEQNEALWRNYLSKSANPNYMHGWDYNFDIETKMLFDTHIIPYMFLVDKDKRVIKKDIFWNEIEDNLKQLID